MQRLGYLEIQEYRESGDPHLPIVALVWRHGNWLSTNRKAFFYPPRGNMWKTIVEAWR